jgi:curli biogenesis system outer membrane secretion channel CsgG
MRKILQITGYLLLINIFAGCMVLRSITKPVNHADTAGIPNPFPPYSGLKAHILVGGFDVKATKAAGETGSGLREMLTSALINSKHFNVSEPQSANLIIAAALTEFEPHASGGIAGVGGGGGVGNGMLGGLLSPSFNKAHIALNIRIIDAATSEVLANSRIQGQASDTAGGFNTPMEKAMRICITEAARYILQTVPGKYYKY